MAFIQSDTYVVPHDKGKGGSGGVTIVYNNGGGSNYNSMNASSINASQAVLDYITAKGITANDASITYLMTKEGQIIKLSGNELYYKSGYIGELTTDSLDVSKIKADEIEALKGYIDTLNSKDITTEYLTVTKQAHFFELIIDKIRSVGGTIILTATNCEIDKVYAYDSSSNNNLLGIDDFSELDNSTLNTIHHFDVYWRADTDGERNVTARRELTNSWVAGLHDGVQYGDQALCQSFNNVKEGKNYNVSNKYYWRLVTEILPDKYINLVTGEMRDVEDGNNDAVELPTSLDFVIGIGNVYTQLNSESEYIANKIGWRVETQSHDTDHLVSWNKTGDGEYGSSGPYAPYGHFITASSKAGIQILPNPSTSQTYEFIAKKIDIYLAQNVGNNVGESLQKANNINIGVYFKDGTFNFFPNVQTNDYYTKTLEFQNANAPIESIVIVSTNEIQWHRCHGITLSNASSSHFDNYDGIYPVTTENKEKFLASCPGPGDNIVQLGYRAYGSGDPNIKRQNAIIISAYNTPDRGGRDNNNNVIRAIVPPSYAQYEGIDDFNLYLHRKTFMDGQGSVFYGDFMLTNDMTIQDKLSQMSSENSKILTDNSNISIVYDRETSTPTITPTTLDFSILYYSGLNTVSRETTVPGGHRVVFKAYTKTGEDAGNTSTIYQTDSITNINTSSLLNGLIFNNSTNVNNLRTLNVTLYKGTAIDSNYVDSINIPIVYTENAKDGDDGETTEIYRLEPIIEKLEASILTATKNNSWSVPLTFDLQYKIQKIAGDSVTYESVWNGTDHEWYCEIRAFNSSFQQILLPLQSNGAPLWFSTSNGDTVAFNSTKTGDTNLLEFINHSSSYSSNVYRDYMKCYTGTDQVSVSDCKPRCPIYLEVILQDEKPSTPKIYDRRIVYVQLENGALFMKTDEKIASAVSGSATGTSAALMEWVENHYTSYEENGYEFILKAGENTIVSGEKDQYGNYKVSNVTISPSEIEAVIGDEYYTKEEVRDYVGTHIGDTKYYSKVLDLFSNPIFEDDKFYPVVVDVASATNIEENGPMIRCQVDMMLDEDWSAHNTGNLDYSNIIYTPTGPNDSYWNSHNLTNNFGGGRPSWGGIDTYTDNASYKSNRGVALLCNWSVFVGTNGEWSVNEKNVYINTYELKWTRKAGVNVYDSDNSHNNIKVIGGTSDSSGIVQNQGKIIFYLRGGAAYNFRFDWPGLYNYISVKTTTYTIGSAPRQYSYPVKTLSDTLYVPTLDRMWKSQILAEADRISLNVWSGDGVTLPNTSEGAGYTYLRNCGIDIGTRNITLKADKVKFTDTTGQHDDKISIDPTTGTLNATNANISGVLTANCMYQDVGLVDAGDTIDLSDGAHSFYICGGSYHSGFDNQDVILPAPSSCPGLQIQFLLPQPKTRVEVRQVLKTPNGSNFYITSTSDSICELSQTYEMPIGYLVTAIAYENYWYITGPYFG